ncbi:4'-phosphopantetheinyl transferase superfamily protein [Paenibacillus sp. HJL G12]|uniref:4'-phosphopantetheinyl transferase superfamily protein n=1 Tax=Paenibacillus dendrobii TaxID=2691084 RepID=A0A7X3IL26_9BACL|nr:4'-phosphopantetheinyl transferase superfamily protein [Paenibacillus dendrobii]MWV45376.1 4'-phosphopantetheinyl transferase superfamily protein [Paenibacillus dendrobii]
MKTNEALQLRDAKVLRLDFIRELKVYHAALCIYSNSSQEVFPEMEQVLHPTELAYGSTLVYEKRRQDYLIGRYAAKIAIHAFDPSTAMYDVQVGHGVFRQPIVRHPNESRIGVSISHSEGLAAAVAFEEEHPMGIDIEYVPRLLLDTVLEQLTDFERRLLGSGPWSKQDSAAALWVSKEALSKTLKTGLTTPLHIFEIEEARFEKGLHGILLICTFRNFFQYKSVVFKWGDYMCSLCFPRKSEMSYAARELDEPPCR